MSLSSTTQQAIASALAELEHDAQGQLSPKNRLAIYDSLGEQINLTQLTQTKTSKFGLLTAGYQRYIYLNLLTVMHIMPIWDADMPRFRAETPDNLAGLEKLPNYILQTAQSVLKQNQPQSKLEQLQRDFWQAINCLPIIFKYDVTEVAIAAYSFFLTVNHRTPFSSQTEHTPTISLATATDVDLYQHSCNWDVAWHASQASCAIDNDPIGTQKRSPIEYDTQKRREFWQWWLTEAVPQASNLVL